MEVCKQEPRCAGRIRSRRMPARKLENHRRVQRWEKVCFRNQSVLRPDHRLAAGMRSGHIGAAAFTRHLLAAFLFGGRKRFTRRQTRQNRRAEQKHARKAYHTFAHRIHSPKSTPPFCWTQCVGLLARLPGNASLSEKRVNRPSAGTVCPETCSNRVCGRPIFPTGRFKRPTGLVSHRRESTRLPERPRSTILLTIALWISYSPRHS